MQGAFPDRPTTAFLLPGVYGDEPQIGAFRRRMAGWLDLDLVDLPHLGTPGPVLSSMALTAERTGDEIARRQPAGAIALFGYSFGASLALAVANRLESEGRRIAFLGILDGPFMEDARRGGHAAMPWPSTVRARIRTGVIDHLGAYPVAREAMLAAAAPALAGPGRRDMLERAIIKNLRAKAITGWDPPSCAAPGLHVHTGVYGPANAPRWRQLCPNLRQVLVPGDHETLLTGASLARIAALIEEAR